jgi:putative NADH-flavin reductase
MKLVILGANGRTGTHVVRRALAEGAYITAVVRSGDKRLKVQHIRLKVVVGDPCDPEFLTGVFRDQDAVISTLGGRSPTKNATSVYHRSARSIVEAAGRTGLKKVVVTSTALLFLPRGWTDRLLAVVARNAVQSATLMEKILNASDLDLTVARCGFLTDADETEYRAMNGALPEAGSSVSRRSLAHFLVDAVYAASSGHIVSGVSAPTRSDA